LSAQKLSFDPTCKPWALALIATGASSVMHFAFPNVQENPQTRELVFRACVRYLSLTPDQAPDSSYLLADPKTPDLHVIHDAV